MPGRSTRFSSSAFVNKFIPTVLIFLVLLLLGALTIIGLSLLGFTPSA